MLKNFRKKSPEFLEAAKKSNLFPLDGLSDESIEARYFLIISFSEKYRFVPNLEKDATGKPIPFFDDKNEEWYWSLSHSKDYIAFIIDSLPCGIDIAEYEERDPSLFAQHEDGEYSILGGKNWRNFYLLWTAKESLIKMLGERIDTLSEIHLRGFEEDIYSFEFRSKNYRIASENNDTVIISSSL